MRKWILGMLIVGGLLLVSQSVHQLELILTTQYEHLLCILKPSLQKAIGTRTESLKGIDFFNSVLELLA